tara:strand:- start:126 stop:260 length:135 start_codon:yes stop_codon:yes gene_type:complete
MNLSPVETQGCEDTIFFYHKKTLFFFLLESIYIRKTMLINEEQI